MLEVLQQILGTLKLVLLSRSKKQDIAYNAAGGNTTIELDADFLSFEKVNIQVVHEGLDAGDSTIRLERSNDKKNWSTFGSANTLASTASGTTDSTDFNISDFGARYIRLTYTANSVTSGNIVEAHIVSKS